MKLLDEAIILRFASGEMDAEEESTFLARCEVAPDCWREAVLAVAEHRRLVEALGELAAVETNPAPAARQTKLRLGRWPAAPTAAAALVAGLLLGIVAMRVAGPVTGRETRAVAASPAAQQPRPAVEPASEVAGSVAAERPDEAAPAPAGLLQMKSIIPDVQRAVLGEHGFQVDEEPTLHVITTADGTQWAVPTQRVTLRYVKQ